MNGDRYIDDPNVIRAFRLFTIIQGAKMEGMGLRRSRGPSCLSILKKEFGFKGARAEILSEARRVYDEMKKDALSI